MKIIITTAVLLLSLISLSKKEKVDFEGVISYKKTVTRLSNNKKAISYEEYTNEELGANSDFYYKLGNHLWQRFPGQGEELFKYKSKYLYVKKNKDFVNWRKNNVTKTNEEITSIKIISETDTILGYECQVLEVKSRLLPLSNGSKMYRKFYFNKENFHINYKYLKNYKINSQNIIFKMIQSLPLRIYIELQGVVLDYEATDVEFKKLEDSLFQIPPSNN
jgi:hypothetical protein